MTPVERAIEALEAVLDEELVEMTPEQQIELIWLCHIADDVLSNIGIVCARRPE